MASFQRLGLLVVVSLSLLLSACPSQRVHLPRPEITPTSAELLAELATRREQRQNLNGEYALEYTDERRHDRATVIAIAEQPNKLYFELIGPTGMLGTMSCDGTQLRRYDAREKVLQIGAANRETIAALSPIPIAPDDLVGYLLALPQPGFAVAASRVDWDGERSAWRLSLSNQDRSRLQQLWFHPQSLAVLLVREYQGKTLIQQASYRGYPQPGSGSALLPEVMRFEVLRPSTKLKLTVRGEVIQNESYPPETFRLAIPKGASVQSL